MISTSQRDTLEAKGSALAVHVRLTEAVELRVQHGGQRAGPQAEGVEGCGKVAIYLHVSPVSAHARPNCSSVEGVRDCGSHNEATGFWHATSTQHAPGARG